MFFFLFLFALSKLISIERQKKITCLQQRRCFGRRFYFHSYKSNYVFFRTQWNYSHGSYLRFNKFFCSLFFMGLGFWAWIYHFHPIFINKRQALDVQLWKNVVIFIIHNNHIIWIRHDCNFVECFPVIKMLLKSINPPTIDFPSKVCIVSLNVLYFPSLKHRSFIFAKI